MTTRNALAMLEAAQHEISGRVAQVTGATERDRLQMQAAAATLELGA